MSELHLLEKGGEHQLSPKGVETSNEHIKDHVESEAALANNEHGTDNHIEAHRNIVEKQSILGSDFDHLKAEHVQPKSTHPLIASLQLKTASWARQMTRTRKRLNPIDRTASKIIHSPIIDKPSEFIGKTIARPQGMLWGSVAAFIGTSALLWATNHYGYEFNYLLVVLLFLGGSLLGTAIEGLTYAFRKNREQT